MAVNVRVVNRRGFEQMLKAFLRACTDRGVLHDWKKHEYYEKPSETRRKKVRQAERDRKKALFDSKRKW